MKRYFLSILICCGAWTTICAQVTKSPKGKVDQVLKDFNQRPDRIMVAAHRAAHTNYPENSIAAIREAIRQGIDIAEVDVRMTKDSVLVLMHDKTITRTTGQKGDVSSYTFKELQQFPLLHNGKPTNERIPAFKEALLLAKGQIIIDIDFKAGSQEAARKTCEEIAATGTAKQVLFFLYDPKEATFIQSINKQIPIMPRSHSAEETAAILAMGKFPVIHVDESFYTDKVMDDIRAAGTRVWINALDEFDNMEKAKEDAGFDALRSKYPKANVVQTDLPEKLLQYLKKKGLHQ